MYLICADLFNSKKCILEEGGIAELEKTASGGKDIATLLIQANQAADEYDKMSDEAVIANMSGMVLAGQDTTASSLTRFLCMMAENSDLQARLRKEILDARDGTQRSPPFGRRLQRGPAPLRSRHFRLETNKRRHRRTATLPRPRPFHRGSHK